MARVTVEDVKAILDNTQLTDPVIEVYITSANTMINESLLGKGLSDNVLKEIERWLAAHMISSTSERFALKEEAGSAKVTYTGVYGMGLDLTSYGQMVKTLDTTGIMAGLGKRTAFIHAVPNKV